MDPSPGIEPGSLSESSRPPGRAVTHEIYTLRPALRVFARVESSIWLLSRLDSSIIAVMHRQMGRSHLDSFAGSTGRADEDDSIVGVGSGIIHITGLVKHSFVRQ